jgi:hypothetical protein
MADFKRAQSKEAVTRQGTTAPSSAESGEHVIQQHGGPVGSGSGERVVMGVKIGAPRKCATPEQNLARRVSAWRVDVAMSVLGWSRSRMANLLGCSPGTVSNYASGETDVTLAAWSLIEGELRRLGLFAEFEVRRMEREHALTKRRIA